MKLNSKYFDSIRVGQKRRSTDGAQRVPCCDWKGCSRPAPHRAPKGRGRDGEYFNFCVDHVKQYNASYNYFDGMSDAEVDDFRKDALTGHRPTWKVGVNAAAAAPGMRPAGPPPPGGSGPSDAKGQDPHNFFAWRAQRLKDEPPPSARRQLKPLEKKSLDALDLGPGATKAEVKARFKELVKRHHPDANGGDTRSEDKLREIIQAYNYLKQAGLV